MDENALIWSHCRELFSLNDFVMEPEVISTMLAFFKAGGSPEEVIDLLVDNYSGSGQMASLLGCWLSDIESVEKSSKTPRNLDTDNCLAHAKEKLKSSATVCESLESAVCTMVSQAFNPDSIDKIFEDESSERIINWLPNLIAHSSWRRLIFQLSEQFPGCLMLNFAVKLISDADYQNEISNVSTAVQQLEVFSGVFVWWINELLSQIVKEGIHSDAYEKCFNEVFRFACHSDQTFLYTQALLHVISKIGRNAAICDHISQKLRLMLEESRQKVSALHIAIIQSESDRIQQHVISAIFTMIHSKRRTFFGKNIELSEKRNLNPADISQLYKAYFEPYPPPIDLIRDPVFVDLLVDYLFNPSRPVISSDHLPKYIYLLAYVSCVSETTRNGIRVQSKADLDSTRRQIEKLASLLHGKNNVDLLAVLRKLKQLAELPILALCVLHHIHMSWVQENAVHEPQQVHFALIDFIATTHPGLHERVFNTLCNLYELQSGFDEVAEIVMARQRAIIDRFVHLLLVGHSLAVIRRVSRMFADGQIDVSLVRYFCTEVLDTIDPPYSPEFRKAFSPLVGHGEVFDDSILEKQKNAKSFLDECGK